MNKKSLMKTALISATILSGAGLFANSAQAQAATPAVHAEQVRGVLQVVDHENQGEVHLYDRDGHVMKQTVKNGKKYKVWEKAYINDELMYRIGTDKQWIPAKYTDWKDAKLGQNVAVASKATNSAYNRENYVGTATINYQGAGNVRLVNSQGDYTSQYLPKNSTWKVWEKADINHEPMYRVGNQSQWVPAKYVTVSSNNNKSLQNNEVHHVSVLGNNTNKSSNTIHNESAQRPVNNSAHTSKGILQGNVNGSTNGNSTSDTAHNTVPAKPVTPTKPAETKPAKPVTPAKPVDSKPTKPVTPAKPVTPSKPVDTKPVEPVAPTKPVEPSKPTTPSKPVEPTTPSKPVTPTTPTTPVKPTEPSKPVQPAQPTKPVEPTKPATPNKPAQPAKPATPTQPAKPVQPAIPTDNNQGQRLTNSQYEQIFWDNYMAPAGWQKGDVQITNDIMKNGAASNDIPWSLGDVDTAYMQLYNGNYVNTPQSKAEFVQDASKLGNEYDWNDTSEYHKATIRATQPDNNSVRIDVLRYN
ncbi:MAG: SLAP domain-containing protein [Lactobacillus johnsonii]|nr:SLAP domain-containing protein [Lactobacillus johnsonii]